MVLWGMMLCWCCWILKWILVVVCISFRLVMWWSLLYKMFVFWWWMCWRFICGICMGMIFGLWGMGRGCMILLSCCLCLSWIIYCWGIMWLCFCLGGWWFGLNWIILVCGFFIVMWSGIFIWEWEWCLCMGFSKCELRVFLCLFWVVVLWNCCLNFSFDECFDIWSFLGGEVLVECVGDGISWMLMLFIGEVLIFVFGFFFKWLWWVVIMEGLLKMYSNDILKLELCGVLCGWMCWYNVLRLNVLVVVLVEY